MIMDGDIIELRAEPVDVGRIVVAVGDGDAGGVVIFLGTTRRDAGERGQTLAALDYQAYETMALEQMRQLAAEARRRWPIRRAAIVHRVGRVEIGQPSVVIAVSTPHRAEAFEACRFLIDSLKKEVSVWKKEVWADGSSSWVEGSQRACGDDSGNY
jgi:molybdopterin synthase catalytic subunit